jgi:amino acid adenylation domain-containing protein
MNSSFTNLGSALEQVSARINTRGIHIITSCSKSFISYREFYYESLRVLAALQDMGVKTGAELLIYTSNNRWMLSVFWAGILGRFIPMPLSAGNTEANIKKVVQVLRKCKNPFIICSESEYEMIKRHFGGEGDEWDRISALIIVTSKLSAEREAIPAHSNPSDIAYVQYSSGSTMEPKGVVLTHANLLANIEGIINRSDITTHDSSLSWMPLSHDMGMICFHLTSLVSGIDQHIISPTAFIKDPKLWLDYATEAGCSLLYSPNFGYQYLLDALEHGEQPNWDLSKIRIIYNGAEPISYSLCNLFVEKLGVAGLARHVIFPGYGLAEASVAVTLPVPGESVVEYSLNRNSLNVGDKIVLDKEGGGSFVEVGYPVLNCKVRISSNSEKYLAEYTVGNIEISGTNVTAGYYNDPDLTPHMFTPDGWLRTGDIGFMSNGKLVVVGRAKDVIIINGQNVYPSDIEMLLSDALREFSLSGIVACGVPGKHSFTQGIALFIPFKGKVADFVPVVLNLNAALGESFGLVAEAIIPVRKIPKTTSGKIQRYKLVEDFCHDTFRDIQSTLNSLLVDSTSSTTVRATLDTLWERTMGYRPATHENVLASGVSSIQLVHFTHMLQSQFQIAITVPDLFELSSLSSLAWHLEAKLFPAIESDPANDSSATLLTPTQQLFFLAAQANDNREAYILRKSFEIRGTVKFQTIIDSIRLIVGRHEVLRSSIVSDSNGVFLEPNEHSLVDDYIEVISPGDSGDINYFRKKPLSASRLFGVTIFVHHESKCEMMLRIHHIVFDGWSFQLLAKELWSLYNDQDPPQLGSSYRAYSARMQKLRHSDEWERDRQFWIKEFADAPDLLHLPLAKLPNSNKPRRAGVERISLPIEDVRSFQQMTNRTGVTEYAGLVAIVNLLLYKYTGIGDIIVGGDLSGRDFHPWNNTIGCFIRPIAVRTALRSEHVFSDVLKLTMEKLIQMMNSGSYSLMELLEELHSTERDQRNSLFNVVVLLQNFESEFEIPDFNKHVTVHSIDIDPVGTMVDIQFEFVRTNNSLKLNVVYDTQKYAESSIQILCKHFQLLFAQATYWPERSLSEFSLTTDEELKTILNWSNAGNQAGNIEDIWSMIDHTSKNHPHAIALEMDDLQLTWSQVRERVAFISQAIELKNIARGNHVGVHLENSIEAVLVMLACLYGGWVYVPIDPKLPFQRKKYLADDSAVRLMITATHTEEWGNIEVIDCQHLYGRINTDLSKTNAQSQERAYIMYTSGTTGYPKGVVIKRESIAAYTKEFTAYFELTGQSIVVQQSILTFDTSLEEILPTLYSGGRLVISPTANFDIQRLSRLLIRKCVTVLSSTPLVIRNLSRSLVTEGSIKKMISGGDVLMPSDVEWLIDHVELFNTYGPTETTICATYNRVTSSAQVNFIGSPLLSKRVYIIDIHGHLVPEGVIGEICVAGNGLTAGYLNAPEANAVAIAPVNSLAERFVYATGDLGAWINGSILFCGRKDRQIKINGYRVEPEELRQCILQAPGTREAEVLIIKQPNGSKTLAAFYVSDLTEKELYRFLTSRLPHYFIPADVVRVDSIPVSSNGKINHKALLERLPTDHVVRATITPIEEKLISLWKEVLDTKVTVASNFFKLGGNSLKGMELIMRVNKAFHTSIGLRELFLGPTLEEMAKLVSVPSNELPIAALEECDHYPATHNQVRLYFLEQMNTKNNVLFVHYVLDSSIETAILYKTFGLLVERHEALRTQLIWIKDDVRQRVHAVGTLNFFETHQAYSEDELNKIIRINQSMAADGNRSLFRVDVVKVAAKTHLLISVHHIISDAWSMRLLQNEFNTLMNDSSVSHLPHASDRQFKDYAIWLTRRENQQAASRHYWKSKLHSAVTSLEIRTAGDTPGTEGSIKKKMSKATTHRLGQFCSTHNVTPYMVVIGAVALLQYNDTGKNHFVVGTTSLGRSAMAEFGSIAGFFVNTLPMVLTIDLNEKISDLIQRTQIEFTELITHEHSSYHELVKNQNGELVKTMISSFDWATSEADGLQIPGIPVTRVNRGYEWRVDFDVTIGIESSDDQSSLIVLYRNSNREILDEYTNELASVLDIITSSENASAQRVLEVFSKDQSSLAKFPAVGRGTEDTIQSDCIVTLFEKYVSAAPEATALVDVDNRFTYRELNTRANQLAHRLIAMGVSPGSIVPIYLERSADLVVAMLGVMKAGAAYLPIDVDYPEIRVHYMIREVDATYIISTSQQHTAIASTKTRIFNIEDIPNDTDDNNPGVDIDGNDMACVIYTSGSSGKPKGVVIEHSGISNLVRWHIAEYGVDNVSRATSMAGVAFDAFGWEIWPYLAAGAAIYIVRDEQRLMVGELRRIIINNNVTHSFVPTAMMPDFVEGSRTGMGKLKYVLTGGDKLSNMDTRDISYKIVNNYGPTENTVVTTCFQLPTKRHSMIPPIGKAILNTSVFLLDSRLKPVPIGAIGEIFISGRSLARGYLNQPELTDEKFIQLSSEFELRLYKTGDLGRWLPDGVLEFVGRVDEQVKIRGYRIELGEIEKTILQHERVKEAVIVVDRKGSDVRLIGFVTVLSELTTFEISKHLSENLPDYMIPASIHIVDTMPVTENGKIDKNVLLEIDRRSKVNIQATPNTANQKLLHQVWCELLGLEAIDMDSNVFTLGAHSLNAMQLAHRVHEYSNIQLSVKDVFAYPTVRSLAQLMDDMGTHGKEGARDVEMDTITI